MKKIALIIFLNLCLFPWSFGQGIFVKGKTFYFPTKDGKLEWYGIALEKEFQNLWGLELTTSFFSEDETRNDGGLDKAFFTTLEARKGFEVLKDDKSNFFITAFTGFGHLEMSGSEEAPRFNLLKTNGLIIGAGVGMKIFFSSTFGVEFSASPRYFFQIDDENIDLEQVRFGKNSIRLGFNFFWCFSKKQ